MFGRKVKWCNLDTFLSNSTVRDLMISSWVLRGKFEKKNYFYILLVSLFFLLPLLSTRTLSTRCDIESGAELQPYQNFDWALRRPNGKSLRLTRRFHHHFSFERRLQHKTNVISPTASQWGQIMLSFSHARAPPHHPRPPTGPSTHQKRLACLVLSARFLLFEETPARVSIAEDGIQDAPD